LGIYIPGGFMGLAFMIGGRIFGSFFLGLGGGG